jgi:peptidyl-dipeptidase A
MRFPTQALLPAILLLIAFTSAAAHGPQPQAGSAAAQAEAAAFLDLFQSIYAGTYVVAADAQWKAMTDVTPEHDGERIASGKALSAVRGDREVIEKVRMLLTRSNELHPVLVRALKRVLLNAAESPGTVPEIVAARVEAESRQSSTLDSFQFCLEREGERCVRPTTANEIDGLLESSRDLDERLKVWRASKETGAVLKPGLVTLQKLRNQVAREMQYASFFDLQVADYDMTTAEMMAMLQEWIAETRPLYEQLHCYAKYTLADRYERPVPARIPAHWIDNRWAQNWTGIVEGVDLDPLFKDKTPEWIVSQAEAFYVSMGFPKLPASFREKSDLYPVPAGSSRKKNTHASAWHVDLDQDVRSLMSVEPNARWFETSHHELGHIYYYISYTRPEVPLVLREGANRGFHEGIGELISIASQQVPYLRQLGLLPKDRDIDRTAWLLNEALSSTIMFLPWSAGTMSAWERDLYANELPQDQWNQRWWSYVAKFQGVDPPEPRGEDLCDACTKTHVNDDPAQYYDYAVATVLKYQLHDHIARKILKVDPHEANYFGRKDVGDFLRSILEKGQTVDWRELLKETTGEELSTRAMLEYFRPLQDYLKKENAGRGCSLD